MNIIPYAGVNHTQPILPIYNHIQKSEESTVHLNLLAQSILKMTEDDLANMVPEGSQYPAPTEKNIRQKREEDPLPCRDKVDPICLAKVDRILRDSNTILIKLKEFQRLCPEMSKRLVAEAEYMLEEVPRLNIIYKVTVALSNGLSFFMGAASRPLLMGVQKCIARVRDR